MQTPEERRPSATRRDAGGQRSDTMMVIHVDPEQKTGFLVSFPRDLVVDIPGLGRAEDQRRVQRRGPQQVIDTLQQNFDIHIHHYLEVDFKSFRGIVDAMGGVPVYFDAPSQRRAQRCSRSIHVRLQAGLLRARRRPTLSTTCGRGTYEKYIDGRLADRSAAATSDRIDRQQEFMRRLATAAFRRSVNNPLTALDIADETIPKLKVDESLGSDDINKLITRSATSTRTTRTASRC